MKIVVIHLSDIHFKRGNNLAFERTEGICGMLRSLFCEQNDLNSCFIVVSGDITFSGHPKEYENALEFFVELRDKVKSLNIFEQIEYVLVPGNHDCDFRTPSKTREIVIKQMLECQDGLLDPYIMDSLTEPQREFFRFLTKLLPDVNLEGDKRLCYERDFELGQRKVKFSCYNTSCMSQSEKQQGQIAFPISKINKNCEGYDLVCTVFHHPYVWFEYSNGKAFRHNIESIADIVFTGHEHDPDSYTKHGITGNFVDYIEGGIFQEENSSDSSFNCVVIDLHNKVQKRSQWCWKDGIYQSVQSTDWEALNRSKSRKRSFENNISFSRQLNDLGVGFTHRHKDSVSLSDIFVYPDLKRIEMGFGASNIPYETIAGDKIIDFVLKSKKVLITGSNLFGKTSLLKTLYSEFLNRGFIPLLINGQSITSPNVNRMGQVIDENFCRQYESDLLEEYKQLLPGKRVILIDDLDKSTLNQKGIGRFLDLVKNMADVVLATGTDLINLEEFVPQVNKSVLSFERCEIPEFGHLLRGRLIKRWVTLGQEYTASDAQLEYKLKSLENTVNTVIGAKLLPSNPFVVLTILQTIEAQIPLDTASGSYGHLYQFVITTAILKSSQRVEDIQKKYNFLSELAYYMLDRGTLEVTRDQIGEVNDIFFKRHDIRVPMQLIDELLQVKILIYQNGCYSFKYPYLYQYFVARYMSNNLRDPNETTAIQNEIEVMTRNLYREDYANIVIFLCFLSKDHLIYDTMLRNAKTIFKDYVLCEMGKDVSFINAIQPSLPKLSIEDRSQEEMREELLKAKDEVADLMNDDDTIPSMSNVEEIDSLDPIIKLNVAFKTIQILGQILRNFPTDLTAELKLRLAEECYSVGLRALKAQFKMIEENFPEMRQQLSQFVREVLRIEDRDEVSDRVDKLSFIIPLALAFSVIKQISYSIGSEELEETYKRVLSMNATTAVSLIDISIKLDHFEDIPVREIVDLHNNLKNNPLSYSLLSLLVVENLFMYRWPRQTRQSVLAQLHIEVKSPRLIEGPSKKLPQN